MTAHDKPSLMTNGRAALLLFTGTLTVMAAAIMSPALPGIHAAFAGRENVEMLTRLVLTTPALAVALFGPVAGWLTDRWGRRRTLLAGLVLYGLGGTSGVWLSSLPAILAGRFILGVGIATLMTAATTFIVDFTGGAERDRYLSLQSAFMGLGGLFYLPLGGLLADVGWRWPFAIYGVAIALVPVVLAKLPGGAGGHALRKNLIPPPRPALGLYLTATTAMVVFYLIPVQAPFLIETRLGVTATSVGLCLGFMTLVSALSSVLFPRVHKRVGSPLLLSAGFLLVAPGFFVLGEGRTWLEVLGGLALVGFGFGQVIPNLNVWVASFSDEENRGRIMGGLTTSIFLGQFLSPLAAGPLMSAGWTVDRVYAAGAAVCVAVAAAAFVVTRK